MPLDLQGVVPTPGKPTVGKASVPAKDQPAEPESDEKKLKGQWTRHPGTGKFVSSKPKPPSSTGGWKTPGESGKKTFGW